MNLNSFGPTYQGLGCATQCYIVVLCFLCIILYIDKNKIVYILHLEKNKP